MDVLSGIDITDGSLLFRVALLEVAADRSITYMADWPMIASEMIASGADAPAMVELASQYSDADGPTIRSLVLEAARDLGLSEPQAVDAVRCLGLMVCRAFVDERITPLQALDLVVELTGYGELDWDLYVAFAPLFDWDVVVGRNWIVEKQVRATARKLTPSEPLESIILRLTGDF